MGATAGILTAVNAVGEAAGQSAQATALTRSADFNARMADIQAKDVLARGDQEAGLRELAARRATGAQRAALAASGVDPNSGTAVDLAGDEAKFSAMDAQMIRNNAAREAWGLRTDAQFRRMGAAADAASLRAQAGATLLTGAVKTYGLFAQPGSRSSRKSSSGSPGRSPDNGDTGGHTS